MTDKSNGQPPQGYKVGPRGHWFVQCADCGRWVKTTGIMGGIHLCVLEARREQ